METQVVFGIIAGIITTISCSVYILAIVFHHTRPSRVTWWTWSVIQLMQTISYWKSTDNPESIWVSVAYTLATITIAILSIWKGHSDKADRNILIGIGLATVVWLITGPIGGLLSIVAIDALASWATIRKSIIHPLTENLTSWGLGFLGNAINLLAIGQWQELAVIYPIYLFIMTGWVTRNLLLYKIRCIKSV